MKKSITISVICFAILVTAALVYAVMFKIGHHYIGLTDKAKEVFVNGANGIIEIDKCEAYHWMERNIIYVKYTGKYTNSKASDINGNLKQAIIEELSQNKELLINELGRIYADAEFHISGKLFKNLIFYKKFEFIIESIPNY